MERTGVIDSRSIYIESLYKRYDDSLDYTIRDLSISFEKGKITTILGKSGCGKTTLLKLIVGLIQPDCGKIIKNEKIGYIAQEKNCFPWLTVRKNIAIGMENVVDSEVEDTLHQVELAKYADWFPAKLSGGLQQRIPIARELLRKCDVLLMDEPFSALDRASKRKLYQLIIDLKKKKGCSIIIVTHDMDEAIEISDDIIAFESEVISKYRIFRDVAFKKEEVRIFLEEMGKAIEEEAIV